MSINTINPDLDSVDFFIDGKSYTNSIKSYDLKYDLFSGSSFFSADIDPNIQLSLLNKPMSFLWQINGEPMMQGFLDKIDRAYSKAGSQFIQSLSGRDMVQVLIDNYILYPSIYGTESQALLGASQDTTGYDRLTNISKVKDIISDALATSNHVPRTHKLRFLQGDKIIKKGLSKDLFTETFTLKYSTAANTIINKVGQLKSIRSSYGQTLFDFISSLLNQIGCYIYNVPGTNVLMVHSLFATSPAQNNILNSYSKSGEVNLNDKPYYISNKNCLSCTDSNDISSYYKYLKIVGQTEGIDLETAGMQKENVVIEKIEGYDDSTVTTDASVPVNRGYQGLTKFKTSVSNVSDANIWKTSRSTIVNNVLLQQNRSLYSLKYVMHNHSSNGTIPYFTNHVARVQDDILQLEKDFIVFSVNFKANRTDGQTTELELSLPASPNPLGNQ